MLIVVVVNNLEKLKKKMIRFGTDANDESSALRLHAKCFKNVNSARYTLIELTHMLSYLILCAQLTADMCIQRPPHQHKSRIHISETKLYEQSPHLGDMK